MQFENRVVSYEHTSIHVIYIDQLASEKDGDPGDRQYLCKNIFFPAFQKASLGHIY